MKKILFFATLFLVMWLALGSTEKRKEYDDEEEAPEEMLDREKRDAMLESGGMHYYFLVLYSKNTMLDTGMI